MQEDDPIAITGGPLKPHEYVLVKPFMDAADEAWIQNHTAKTRKSEGGETELVLTIGDVQLATAKRMIKGWNLTRTVTNPINQEKTTVPIPFSTQAIEKLRRPLYQYLLKKINEMNPDEDEEGENQEAFLPAVVDSPEDSLQAERVYHLKH